MASTNHELAVQAIDKMRQGVFARITLVECLERLLDQHEAEIRAKKIPLRPMSEWEETPLPETGPAYARVFGYGASGSEAVWFSEVCDMQDASCLMDQKFTYAGFLLEDEFLDLFNLPEAKP